ncbi:MAG TPA: tetratricopeptide repeat protein [Abditibacteriaceae bacterium]|nr:tetratricopeptide repeat protein [Abditibacteriaceae bacterium]
MPKILKWPLMGVVVGSFGVVSCAMAAPAHEHPKTTTKAAPRTAAKSSTRKAKPVVAAKKKSLKEQKLDKLREESDAAYHKGDYPGAIAKFKAIVALDPTDYDSFGTGAWLLWSLGRGDEATAFMRRGVAANPRNWEMWEEAGNHFMLRKILPDAQRCFARAAQLAPKKANTRILRHRWALTAERNGDLPTARRVWQSVVRIYPTDASAARKLKQVEAKMNEAPGAKDV